ncbi:MAG: hypothetical protein WA208_16070, partial [Thermoanaerobaculia bacterium]
MHGNTLQIEYVKLSELNAYQPSPRVHPVGQRRKARAILERYGQAVPILIDENNIIVDGHLIADEWKALGNEQIGAVVVRGRSNEEIRALRLALNRLPQDGKWDPSKLKAEFEALIAIGYDLDLTAFDAVEIEVTLTIDDPSGAVVEDAPPTVAPDAVAVSRLGDRWA